MEVLGNDKVVRLYDLVDRLPKDLLADEFYGLVGTKTNFTQKEADEIVQKANTLRHETQSKISETDRDAIDDLVETIIPSKKEVNKEPASMYLRDPDRFCRGLLPLTACNAAITDKGVDGSGFCECCWYPSIVEDYARYKEHRREGFGRTEAIEMAGIIMPVPPQQKKRKPTYAERKSGRRTDKE